MAWQRAENSHFWNVCQEFITLICTICKGYEISHTNCLLQDLVHVANPQHLFQVHPTPNLVLKHENI